ncbi:MAG: chromosomal replication initiator protein DnaA, partial [Clostridiales bacterium]|nr:chromosomal replication initiator protein DnaA [Clostridiales bacterium]
MNTEEIINRTCEYFGLTREELMSDTRKRDVALPRQIAMYACRKLTTL